MSSVYISFRYTDEPFVRRLIQDLETAGHTVRSSLDHRVGSVWTAETTRWIASTQFQLAVITPEYLQGDSAKRELELLRTSTEERKGTLWLLIVRDAELPDWLRGMRWLDFTEYSTGLTTLLSALSEPPPAAAAATSGPRGKAKAPATRKKAAGRSASSASRQQAQVADASGPAPPGGSGAGAGGGGTESGANDGAAPDLGFELSEEVTEILELAYGVARAEGAPAVFPWHVAWALVERGRATAGDPTGAIPSFVWATMLAEAGEDAAAEVTQHTYGVTSRLPDDAPRLPLTPAAADLFRAASTIARITTRRSRPGARHLLGALLTLREDPDVGPPFNRVLATLGLERGAFIEKLKAAIAHSKPNDSRARWAEVLDGERSLDELLKMIGPARTPEPTPPPALVPPPPPEPVTAAEASNSDQPSRTDHLGFGPYVEAVAAFLKNKDTVPPLTISIEGEWGSGKSSFMRQLQDRIESPPPDYTPPAPGPFGRATRWIVRRLGKGRETEPAVTDPSVITVWFNPWRHDKEEAVWAAFALEFLRCVARRLPRRDRWRGHWKLLLTRFRWRDGWLDALRALGAAVGSLGAMSVLAYLLVAGGLLTRFSHELADSHAPAPPSSGAGEKKDDDQLLLEILLRVGGAGGALAVAVTFAKQAKSFVGNPLRVDLKKYVSSPDYHSRISFVEHFHEDFGRIVRSYVGRRRVYVFVDDLDRCEVPKAADLMQALNLMMGVEEQPIFFILGMDREKIAASLAVKFKELLPYVTADANAPAAAQEGLPLRGLEYGSDFIEKFVQIAFPVPQPREADVKTLLESLSTGETGVPADAVSARRTRGAQGDAATARSRPKVPATKVFPRPEDSAENVARESSRASSADGDAGVVAEREARDASTASERAVAKDSKRLREIALALAPALEHNPRRIKQFLNVFRLRAYIAGRTGVIADGGTGGTLTYEQLAKFVAISLRWPVLAAAVQEDEHLLGTLESRAMERSEPANERERFWLSKPRLCELLRAGIVMKDRKPTPETERWSLAGVDVDALLQVAAPAPKPQPSVPPPLPTPAAPPVPA